MYLTEEQHHEIAIQSLQCKGQKFQNVNPDIYVTPVKVPTRNNVSRVDINIHLKSLDQNYMALITIRKDGAVRVSSMSGVNLEDYNYPARLQGYIELVTLAGLIVAYCTNTIAIEDRKVNVRR